jgi:hypothetical protein
MSRARALGNVHDLKLLSHLVLNVFGRPFHSTWHPGLRPRVAHSSCSVGCADSFHMQLSSVVLLASLVEPKIKDAARGSIQ